MRDLRILSLGAGVQSTTVYLLGMDGALPVRFDAAIFADTQEEPAAVYAHLAWLQSLNGPPIIVRTAGKLGDDLIAGRNSTGQRFVGIPAYTAPAKSLVAVGQMKRQCSREYKAEVVERAIRRDVFGLKPRQRWPKGVLVHHYFGISLDEARRTIGIRKRVLPPRQEPHFPLIDRGWTRGDCLRWLADRVPHRVPRSSCVFCPYRSDAEFLWLKENDPDGWRRAVEVDEAVRSACKLARKYDQRIYVHPTARPLATVTLKGEGQGAFPYFALECQGVCGV